MDSFPVEAGVIAGIIVGILGILVVLGVSIVLVKLLCCKEKTCCCGGCCKMKDAEYLTGPIPTKANEETSNKDQKPISITSQSGRLMSRLDISSFRRTPNKKRSSQEPPEYEDLPQFSWKLNDLQKGAIGAGPTALDEKRTSSLENTLRNFHCDSSFEDEDDKVARICNRGEMARNLKQWHAPVLTDRSRPNHTVAVRQPAPSRVNKAYNKDSSETDV